MYINKCKISISCIQILHQHDEKHSFYNHLCCGLMKTVSSADISFTWNFHYGFYMANLDIKFRASQRPPELLV